MSTDHILPSVGQVWREKYPFRDENDGGEKPPRRMMQIAEIKGERVSKISPINKERPFGPFSGIAFATLWEKWELVTKRSELRRPPRKPGEIEMLLSMPGLCELVRNAVYLSRYPSERTEGRVIQVTNFDDEKVWKKEIAGRERTNKPSSVEPFRKRWVMVARTFDEWVEFLEHNKLPGPMAETPINTTTQQIVVKRRPHVALTQQVSMLEQQVSELTQRNQDQDKRVEQLTAQIAMLAMRLEERSGAPAPVAVRAVRRAGRSK